MLVSYGVLHSEKKTISNKLILFVQFKEFKVKLLLYSYLSIKLQDLYKCLWKIMIINNKQYYLDLINLSVYKTTAYL